MQLVRQTLLRHRGFVAWLVALALIMKVLVPTGFMIGSTGGRISVQLCDGVAHMASAAPMAGMAHHDPKQDGSHKDDRPCAFAALSAPSLGGADPLPIVGAIASIAFLPAGLAAQRDIRSIVAFLRPPLRGPPASL